MILRIFAIGLTTSVSALVLFCLWGLSQIPSEKFIRGCFTTQMYQVELCPQGPNYVPLKSISPFMQKTLLLAEDSTFYQHKGFDWESIEKSAQENLQRGTYKRGGSTLTQQLAKNLFLTKDKTLTRKALEAVLTLKLEQVLSKSEILERYLNVVEFGKDIYGIKAAARHYFSKSPSQLDLAESAFLVMLLPNPVKYSTSFHRKELTAFARNRIETLITNMYQYHRVTQTDYDVALARIDNLFGSEFSYPSIDQQQNLKVPSTEEANSEEAEDDFL